MTDPTGAVTAVETHSAMLFFVADRVYKAKKALDLGFLDFRSVEARRDACEREVSLNRRLAPDVYHGVAEVRAPDGQVCEHLVVMDRMPDERRLSRCLDTGAEVIAVLTEVARQLSTLHAASPPAAEMARVATGDSLRRLWQDGFDAMGPHASGTDDAPLLDPAIHSRIEHLVGRYFDGRSALFAERIDSGCVRDGHGDLQAEDIFCLDDGPRVLDCLEFDDELRWGDVLSDVAFLAMDLERLGHPELASTFLEQYRERSGATWPPSLAHFYMAYRAHVRAKVGVIREVQTGERSDAVDVHQRLALAHLEAGEVRLILVGGLPGTGKSTIALALAERTGAVVVRSDELRDDIPRERRYEPSSVAQVYTRMLERAEDLMSLGHHVVLDATWSEAQRRGAARSLAARSHAEMFELRCELDAAVADRRIEERRAAGADPSEATPQVAHRLAGRFEVWPEATAIHTGGPVATSLELALGACGWA